MMPLLTTKGLSRNFGGLRAVDNVDFALMPGEIRAVIGPNGAGKTTFVSLVSGRIQPSSGMIVFDGADITNLPAYARVRLGVAYTFQITSVFANLSAYDNVALPVQRTLTDGRSKDAVKAGVMAALERTGLADRAHMPAGQLSYGHQRLLEVAMGLALKPRLLILDEPAAGMNPSEKVGLQALLKRIAAKGLTILIIDHDMTLVTEVAVRITVLNFGRLIADGVAADVLRHPDVIAAYLGSEPDAPDFA